MRTELTRADLLGNYSEILSRISIGMRHGFGYDTVALAKLAEKITTALTAETLEPTYFSIENKEDLPY